MTSAHDYKFGGNTMIWELEVCCLAGFSLLLLVNACIWCTLLSSCSNLFFGNLQICNTKTIDLHHGNRWQGDKRAFVSCYLYVSFTLATQRLDSSTVRECGMFQLHWYNVCQCISPYRATVCLPFRKVINSLPWMWYVTPVKPCLLTGLLYYIKSSGDCRHGRRLVYHGYNSLIGGGFGSICWLQRRSLSWCRRHRHRHRRLVVSSSKW